MLPSILATTVDHMGPIESVAYRFGVSWPLLIAQIINFCIVAFLLYRFAFKPVLATMEERQNKIAEGLKFTEESRLRLEASEQEYADAMHKASLEAKDIIAEAKQTAKDHIEHQSQEAMHKAEHILKSAEDSIKLERDKMIGSIRKEVTHLVIDTTKKVLSKELSDKDRKVFSESAAKELVN